MKILLPLVYICLLFFQIVMIILEIKRNDSRNFFLLLGLEIVSIITGILFLIYYNNQPGYGIMPGLTYFSETIYSFIAIIAYSVILLCTVFIGILRRKK